MDIKTVGITKMVSQKDDYDVDCDDSLVKSFNNYFSSSDFSGRVSGQRRSLGPTKKSPFYALFFR